MPARPLYPILRLGALLVASGMLLFATSTAPPVRPAAPNSEAWVDTRWVRGVGEGAKMEGPRGPQQKRPPCLPRTEQEHFGACWALHGELPPCPDGTFETKGRCFMPVLAAKREPTSVVPGSRLP